MASQKFPVANLLICYQARVVAVEQELLVQVPKPRNEPAAEDSIAPTRRWEGVVALE